MGRLFPAHPLDVPAPGWNLAPTDPVPVVRVARDGTPRLGRVRWGLVPHWARDPAIGSRLINARAETVAEKPAFRDAFRRRRCLILASGFYEWARGEHGKVPHFVQREDGEPLVMAGLWERWHAPDSEGPPLDTCVIVTTAASAEIAALHDRMPAILVPADFATWLDREHFDAQRLLGLLRPWEGPPPLVARPVSSRVNDPREDGPDLIQTAAAAGG